MYISVLCVGRLEGEDGEEGVAATERARVHHLFQSLLPIPSYTKRQHHKLDPPFDQESCKFMLALAN